MTGMSDPVVATQATYDAIAPAYERRTRHGFTGRDDEIEALCAALPLADRSVDGVWCHAAMLHVPLVDVPTALAEFARVVRPSGALYLAVVEGDGEGFQPSAYDGHPPRWFAHHREEPLRALLDRVGFDVGQVTRHRTDGTHAPRDWLMARARRR